MNDYLFADVVAAHLYSDNAETAFHIQLLLIEKTMAKTDGE